MIQRRHPTATEPRPKKSRVLCVDDETMIGELVAQILRTQLGCEVVTAGNGEEALDAIREMEFEVVLVDYLMPNMDGGELYRHLKIERPDLLPRLLFMTGDILSETTLDDIESTGRRLLKKPFSIIELTEAIKSMLHQQSLFGARAAS